jgi:hypothetical protein
MTAVTSSRRWSPLLPSPLAAAQRSGPNQLPGGNGFSHGTGAPLGRWQQVVDLSTVKASVLC